MEPRHADNATPRSNAIPGGIHADDDAAIEALLADALGPTAETAPPSDLSNRILAATRPAIVSRRRTIPGRLGIPASRLAWAGLAAAAVVLLTIGLTWRVGLERAVAPPASSIVAMPADAATGTWADPLDQRLARIAEQAGDEVPGHEAIDAELAMLAWDIENVDENESYAAVASAIKEWSEQWDFLDDEAWDTF